MVYMTITSDSLTAPYGDGRAVQTPTLQRRKVMVTASAPGPQLVRGPTRLQRQVSCLQLPSLYITLAKPQPKTLNPMLYARVSNSMPFEEGQWQVPQVAEE